MTIVEAIGATLLVVLLAILVALLVVTLAPPSPWHYRIHVVQAYIDREAGVVCYGIEDTVTLSCLPLKETNIK